MYFFSLIFVLFAYVIPGNAAAAAAAGAPYADHEELVVAATHRIMEAIAEDKIVLKRVANLLALREALLEQVYMRALHYKEASEDQIAATIFDAYLVDLFEAYQQLYDALPQGIQILLQQFDELLYGFEGFSLNFALQHLVVHHAIKERGLSYNQLLIQGTMLMREVRTLCVASLATAPVLSEVVKVLERTMLSDEALTYVQQLINTKNSYMRFIDTGTEESSVKGYNITINACRSEMKGFEHVLRVVKQLKEEKAALTDSMGRCADLLSDLIAIDRTIIDHAHFLIQKRKDNDKDYRLEREDLIRFAAQYTGAHGFKRAHTSFYEQVISKLSAEEKNWDCKVNEGKMLPRELFFINTVILSPSSLLKFDLERLFFLYSKIGYHGAIKSGLNPSIPGALNRSACMTFVMQHLGLTDAKKFYREAEAAFHGKILALELEGKGASAECERMKELLARCVNNRGTLVVQAPGVVKQALAVIERFYDAHHQEQCKAFLERDALYVAVRAKPYFEQLQPFFEGAELWNYLDPVVIKITDLGRVMPDVCHTLNYPFYHCARNYYQELAKGTEAREVLPEMSTVSGELVGQISGLAAALNAFLPSDELREAFDDSIKETLLCKRVNAVGGKPPRLAKGGGAGGAAAMSAFACKAAASADKELDDDESISGSDDVAMEMKVAAAAAAAGVVGGDVVYGAVDGLSEVITYKKFHRSYVLYEDNRSIVLVQYHRSGLGRTLVIHKETDMPHRVTIDAYTPHVESKMCGYHVGVSLQGLCRWDRSHEFPLKVDKYCFPYGRVEQNTVETRVTMRAECYPLGYDPRSTVVQRAYFVGMLTWVVKREAGKNVCSHRMIEATKEASVVGGGAAAGGGAGGAP